MAAIERERVRRPAATGPLIVDPFGQRLTPQGAGERWRPLRNRAGLTGCRFHDLRGSFVTLALAAGVPPVEVARSAGHDVATMLRVYASAVPGGRELVADAIEQALR